MKKYTNNWITAIDATADNSGVRLVFETERDGKIVELTTEYWERNAKGEMELYEVVRGEERSKAFASLRKEWQQNLIIAAMQQKDEPVIFAA